MSLLWGLGSCSALLLGCQRGEATSRASQPEVGEIASLTETTSSDPSPASRVVRLEPKSGSELVGTVTLTEVAEGVRVVLDVAGISPGQHGVHVHEYGDCSAPDAKSAGDH